eukprot:jgi/Undpi1/8378/HiC_scaffold_25.g10846.m1
MGSGAACAWSDDSSGCLVAWGKTEIGTMLELLSHRYTLDVAMMVAAALLMTIKDARAPHTRRRKRHQKQRRQRNRPLDWQGNQRDRSDLRGSTETGAESTPENVHADSSVRDTPSDVHSMAVRSSSEEESLGWLRGGGGKRGGGRGGRGGEGRGRLGEKRGRGKGGEGGEGGEIGGEQKGGESHVSVSECPGWRLPSPASVTATAATSGAAATGTSTFSPVSRCAPGGGHSAPIAEQKLGRVENMSVDDATLVRLSPSSGRGTTRLDSLDRKNGVGCDVGDGGVEGGGGGGGRRGRGEGGGGGGRGRGGAEGGRPVDHSGTMRQTSYADEGSQQREDGGVIAAETGGGQWLAPWLRLLESWTISALVTALFVRQVVFSSNRHFWVSKALDLWVSPQKQAIFPLAESILLLRFPYGVEAGFFAASIMAAARVRSRAEKAMPPRPVPTLVSGSLMTCLGAFGGNILASLLLETRSMLLVDDLAFPIAVSAWAIIGGRPTPPPPPPSITEPVVLSSSAGRDREGERSSSRRRQGGVRSGSSSPAPARRIPTGGGTGDGNGSGWAGLGGWAVKEALIWTAAALVMIALGRWLVFSALTTDQSWSGLYQNGQQHSPGPGSPFIDARDLRDRSADRSDFSLRDARDSGDPFQDLSHFTSATADSNDRSQDRSAVSLKDALDSNDHSEDRSDVLFRGTRDSSYRYQDRSLLTPTGADAATTVLTAASAASHHERGEETGTLDDSFRDARDSSDNSPDQSLYSPATDDLRDRSQDWSSFALATADTTISDSTTDDAAISAAAQEGQTFSPLEYLSDRRVQAQEGRAFSSSPSSELLLATSEELSATSDDFFATLEKFSEALGEFSDVSKAWLEEMTRGGGGGDSPHDVPVSPGLQQGLQELTPLMRRSARKKPDDENFVMGGGACGGVEKGSVTGGVRGESATGGVRKASDTAGGRKASDTENFVIDVNDLVGNVCHEDGPLAPECEADFIGGERKELDPGGVREGSGTPDIDSFAIDGGASVGIVSPEEGTLAFESATDFAGGVEKGSDAGGVQKESGTGGVREESDTKKLVIGGGAFVDDISPKVGALAPECVADFTGGIKKGPDTGDPKKESDACGVGEESDTENFALDGDAFVDSVCPSGCGGVECTGGAMFGDGAAAMGDGAGAGGEKDVGGDPVEKHDDGVEGVGRPIVGKLDDSATPSDWASTSAVGETQYSAPAAVPDVDNSPPCGSMPQERPVAGQSAQGVSGLKPSSTTSSATEGKTQNSAPAAVPDVSESSVMVDNTQYSAPAAVPDVETPAPIVSMLVAAWTAPPVWAKPKTELLPGRHPRSTADQEGKERTQQEQEQVQQMLQQQDEVSESSSTVDNMQYSAPAAVPGVETPAPLVSRLIAAWSAPPVWGKPKAEHSSGWHWATTAMEKGESSPVTPDASNGRRNRSRDPQNAKAEAKALKRAQQLATIQRKREFEELQQSKMRAIEEAENREMELLLREQLEFQAQKASHQAFRKEKDSTARNGADVAEGVGTAIERVETDIDGVETAFGDRKTFIGDESVVGDRESVVGYRETFVGDHETVMGDGDRETPVGDCERSLGDCEDVVEDNDTMNEGVETTVEGAATADNDTNDVESEKTAIDGDSEGEGNDRSSTTVTPPVESRGKGVRVVIGVVVTAMYYTLWAAITLALG